SFPIKNKEVTFKNLNSYWTVDSEENDKSLVIYSEIGGKEFLFMGDATIKIENSIMKDYKLDIDILKLGHHGSDTSSSYDFLKYIHPKVAIISCGKNNKYHHPSLSTLQSLNKLGIPYRRTDEEGTITYKFYSI
ncbi:MAG: DNA internalization-related competence protein ComEC/Rec2, partial [Candidatus Onthovivens sp.]|nr:DNA internalization-related competence protein ComEC/Rec2 [Candidatus Onthovivens sp.]